MQNSKCLGAKYKSREITWLESITKADIMSLAARHVEQPCITHARSEQSLERCWHSTLEKISYSSWNNTSREEKKDPVLWFYQTLPIPASTSKQWFPVVGKHSWFLRIPIPLACRYRRRPIANFVRFLNI